MILSGCSEDAVPAELTGLIAGLLISLVTAPVGVSGAVFLLPVQLSVLAVPSPSVTPTNLLFNVVAGPGALLRRHRGDACSARSPGCWWPAHCRAW